MFETVGFRSSIDGGHYGKKHHWPGRDLFEIYPPDSEFMAQGFQGSSCQTNLQGSRSQMHRHVFHEAPAAPYRTIDSTYLSPGHLVGGAALPENK